MNKQEIECGCTGCNNIATHTWSGHPTCNACSPTEWRGKLPDTKSKRGIDMSRADYERDMAKDEKAWLEQCREADKTHVTVPREPTEAMIKAGQDKRHSRYESGCVSIYKAMIGASEDE